jgi:transposase InsO family protein
MPFMETCRMEERIQMLKDWDSGNWTIVELSKRYGISRATFYEWQSRRESGDEGWFQDRSHAPQHCPHRTDEAVAQEVVALRRRYPHLGPRKLLAMLERQAPERRWPAASTIGDILKQAGLVKPARRRRRALDQERPFAVVAAANDEWSADFKGWFRTRDQRRIDPLTVKDSHSRFLLAVRSAAPTVAGVQPIFAALFREHGLPGAIRSDNGSPFGSRGPAGLTRLSAWWLKLGLEVRFIHPASPQENGRHERMHRELKKLTSRPPAETAQEQQDRFDWFRRHYNEERPHEALGQRVPASAYRCSPRPMPERIEDPWYDADHHVRRVHSSGEIKWSGGVVFISEALVGELIGIAELATGDHVVRFCGLDLGLLDRSGTFRRFAPPRPGRSKTPNLSTILPVQNVDHHPG